MQRSRWKTTAVVALLLTLLVRPAMGAAAPAPTVLRIATLLPRGTSWMREFERFARRLRRGTAGRVTIRIYAGAIKGDERDMVRLLRKGRLDGAALTGVGLGMFAPSMRVLDVPFIFRSDRELDAARQAVDGELRADFRRSGVELVAWAAVGWIHVFSKQPLADAKALARARIWSWVDDQMAIDTVAALGLGGVRLGVPDVLPGLQTGLIDAIYGSAYTTLALQWHTQLRYCLPVRITHSSAAVVLRRAAFDALRPADRRLLLREASRFQRRHLAQSRAENARAMAQLHKMGIVDRPLDARLLESLRRRVERMRRGLVGRLYSEALLKKVLRARDAMRAKVSGASRASVGK